MTCGCEYGDAQAGTQAGNALGAALAFPAVSVVYLAIRRLLPCLAGTAFVGEFGIEYEAVATVARLMIVE